MNQPDRMRRLPWMLGCLLVVAVAAAVPLAAQQTVRVELSMDPGETGTRVLLTHDRSVGYAVRADRGRIEVIYTDAIRIDPGTRSFEDEVLLRYELRGSRRLVLYTGEGYRGYESFDLRNPFRLVLDLLGSRSDAGALERRRPDRSIPIIVLDPGHGGSELGAVGPSGLEEKNVALDLARRVRQILQQEGGLSVVLTRDEDRLLGLDERTAIANHNRADLFVSVHLNATRRGSASGAETYFLAQDATDDEARTTAALENRAYGVDEETVPGQDLDGLELVLWDLAQNQFLSESSRLAERVQGHMNRLTGTRNRGVRQAPFRVLMGATMPAVLVEVGFISNPEEERKFKTLSYRNRVAEALARAIREYVADLERLRSPAGGSRGARAP